MNFVLDASIALAWAFEDERTDRAVRALDALEGSEAVAPAIWALEVSNGLLTAQRRGLIAAPAATRFAHLLLALPIVIDRADRGRSLDDVRRLARSLDLSVYNASYLDLAMHFGVPLATLDATLEKAAELAGVEVFGG